MCTQILFPGIGLHSNQKSIKHPDVVNAQHTTFITGVLVASVIHALLVIGGVEINPGHLTPNEFVGNKASLPNVNCFLSCHLIYLFLELPTDVQLFVEFFISTSQTFNQVFQSLSSDHSSRILSGVHFLVISILPIDWIIDANCIYDG